MQEDEDLIRDLRVCVEQVEERLRAAKVQGPPLLLVARRIYALRQLRHRFFAAGLFADPAWDMLLDLYIAAREGRHVSVSSACAGAAVPPTTGLRWLRRMEEEGLVLRRASPTDGRRIFVELTDDAIKRLEKVLSQAPGLGVDKAT